MATDLKQSIDVPPELLEAIRSLPATQTVAHCGETFSVSSLAVYAQCPKCGVRVKARSFSAEPELQDVFDAVFTWMLSPDVRDAVNQRMSEVAEDIDD